MGVFRSEGPVSHNPSSCEAHPALAGTRQIGGLGEFASGPSAGVALNLKLLGAAPEDAEIMAEARRFTYSARGVAT